MYKKWSYYYDDEWIIENYKGICDATFYKAYIEHTHSDVPKDTFRKHLRRLPISTTYLKPIFTEEMEQFVIDKFSTVGRIKCYELFVEKFSMNITIESFDRRCKKLGLYVDREVSYRNRHKLHGMNRDCILPEGYICTDKTGYKMIKVNGKYYPYRKYIYEKHFGEVPKGYSVTYLGDPDDYSIENTVCIPSLHVLLLTSNNLRSANPEITRAGIEWCKLHSLINVGGGRIKKKYNR